MMRLWRGGLALGKIPSIAGDTIESPELAALLCCLSSQLLQPSLLVLVVSFTILIFTV